MRSVPHQENRNRKAKLRDGLRNCEEGERESRAYMLPVNKIRKALFFASSDQNGEIEWQAKGWWMGEEVGRWLCLTDATELSHSVS
jgi:hypothetical protein